MAIQRATIEDSQTIYDIAQAAFQPSPWPKSVFEHELTSPRSRYFVTPGGFIGVTQILDEVDIGSLAVHPNRQKQGIAQALLAHVLDMPGVVRFLLEVDEANENAMRLYEKMGFVAYYRREKYYKNGHAAIMMERKM
ncbi:MULTISPECIES: ribosomal protein S18-alanine N-acetyltransferase [Leuconostoc]|uniref:[Ribosomal protein bS18]-alanine N-acetyltransferase n=1 Tax=Leuconostoc holzapfelii TaxID=434464 RepID=A0A846Z8D4_9LACO|nr:ribosomal protein S18-alanine N-acetyltransferase [Leuconostoc holzapfelii]NKZ17977.1 ribosomal protein S18-alanine N-acetyltransferase [Leuconostoc holzapfelii]